MLLVECYKVVISNFENYQQKLINRIIGKQEKKKKIKLERENCEEIILYRCPLFEGWYAAYQGM